MGSISSANDMSAFIPQRWALESVAQFWSEAVLPGLVYRDYEEEFKSPGKTVNVPTLPVFEAVRKTATDAVTYQDMDCDSVPVRLDQWLHVTTKLSDEDLTLSFPGLREKILVPQIRALSLGADRIVMGEGYNFLGTAAGKIGTAVDFATMRELSEKMTRNKMPRSNRWLVVGPGLESDIQGISQFTEAQMNGDGSVLRTGLLGQCLGFQVFGAGQSPELTSLGIASTVVGRVNNSAGYEAGTETLVVDGITGAWKTGASIKIAGELQPHIITAHTESGSDTTGITITPPLNASVANDAVITYYTPGAVNLSAGYAAGYAKTIVVDGFTGTSAIKVGQGVYLGGYVYGVIGVTDDGSNVTGITLNRPLDAAIANDDFVCPIPPANYGLAGIKNAIALVCRPLRPPDTTVKSATVVDRGIAIRVTIGYNFDYQCDVVTTDMLLGVKTMIDTAGAVLIG